MFATKDRLPQGSAPACPPAPFRKSLSAPAIFTQTRNCAPHHQTAPQRSVVIPKGSPVARNGSAVTASDSVVIPRPEGRGICFSSAREQNAPPVFSMLRSLSPSAKPQLPLAHQVAHSSSDKKKVTAAFSVASKPSVRSRAPERKPSHLLSVTCELFCKNKGGGGRMPATPGAKVPGKGSFRGKEVGGAPR